MGEKLCVLWLVYYFANDLRIDLNNHIWHFIRNFRNGGKRIFHDCTS